MGTMILGMLVWFGLLKEIDHFNPVRAVITVATGTLFLIMVFHDKKETRLRFAIAYVVFMASSIVFDFMQAYADVEEKHFVENTCKDMESRGQFKAMGIESAEACKDVVQAYIDKTMMFALLVVLLIDLHFGLVVYTHAQDADKVAF